MRKIDLRDRSKPGEDGKGRWEGSEQGSNKVAGHAGVTGEDGFAAGAELVSEYRQCQRRGQAAPMFTLNGQCGVGLPGLL